MTTSDGPGPFVKRLMDRVVNAADAALAVTLTKPNPGRLYRYHYQADRRWHTTTVWLTDAAYHAKPFTDPATGRKVSPTALRLRAWGYPGTDKSFILEPLP